MSNNVEKLWDLYKDILSIESVRQHLVLPSNYCNESTLALIPSLEASTAGVRVRSIFMITENYLCEIRTQTENDFDIALKKSVTNIRISMSDTLDEKKNCHASIQLNHGDALKTSFNFFGSIELRNKWYRSITEVIPVSILNHT